MKNPTPSSAARSSAAVAWSEPGLPARYAPSLDYSRTMKEKSHRVSRRCYRSGVEAFPCTAPRRLDGHSLYSASRLPIRGKRQAGGRGVRSEERRVGKEWRTE